MVAKVSPRRRAAIETRPRSPLSLEKRAILALAVPMPSTPFAMAQARKFERLASDSAWEGDEEDDDDGASVCEAAQRLSFVGGGGGEIPKNGFLLEVMDVFRAFCMACTRR